MKPYHLIVCAAAAAFLCSCAQETSVSVSDVQPPHLEKRGAVTQLIVEGEPFLALAGELKNSSSSSREYMEPHWPRLKAAGLNTVIAPLSWEQIEPVEGQFDFANVDALIEDAREQDLKLMFLWLASWKNGISSYEPVWVKSDTERFPLAKTPEGKSLPILTTQGAQTAAADAAAFAALMKHIREVDATEQTVIMMQMENEVGLHGHTRDYHPLAVAAFEGPVPQQLIDYLSANYDKLIPEMRAAWDKGGKKTSGSWEEVFGKGDYTDELFMAWSYASYMEKVSAAGKAEYDIPIYTNAWIVQPEDKHPGNYPSGGPQAQNHDVWRAAAPHIDILSPDIYLDDYPQIIRMYARGGNPVFVPESRAGQGGAANAAFTFGEMGGIGYSPFGIENSVGDGTDVFCQFYKAVGSYADVLLKAQAEGRIAGVWVKGANPAVYKDERVMGDVKVCVELVSSGWRNGGAPQLTGGSYRADAAGYAIIIREDEGFLILGSNVRVVFRPAEGDDVIGIAKMTEGYFEDGEWVERRWLNGDEIQLRYDILAAVDEGLSGQGLNFGTPMPQFMKVQLFRYQ